MLPRTATFALLLLFAGHTAAQDGTNSSSYGPPSRRVIQPAAYAISDEPAAEEAAEEAPERVHAAEASLPEARSPLKLAPRNKAATASKELTRPAATSPTSAITTVAGSLGIVLALFVLLVWFSRRFAPAGTAAIPKEAVELLGRSTLSGTHQMQLVRVGTKLLLVAITPQGVRTLTEIHSAAEVERLCEICRRQKPDSSSASFRSLVDQIGSERTTGSFVDSTRRPVAATAAPRSRVTARA